MGNATAVLGLALIFTAAARADFCIENGADYRVEPWPIPGNPELGWSAVEPAETRCFEDYDGLLLLRMRRRYPDQLAQVHAVAGGLIRLTPTAAYSYYPDGRLREMNAFGEASGRQRGRW